MFRNEKELRDHTARLLKKKGFKVRKEFRIPEKYRIDLVATKNAIKNAIEVKYSPGDIENEINKCYTLHKFPEFDHVYVAAPAMLFSPDHVSFAKKVKVGLISVGPKSIKWLVKSQPLKPARIGWSSNTPSQNLVPGSRFHLTLRIENKGEKVARHLEGYVATGKPFASVGVKRIKRASLKPGGCWKVTFEIRIRDSAHAGKYPLYYKCTADNIEPCETVWHMIVESPGDK